MVRPQEGFHGRQSFRRQRQGGSRGSLRHQDGTPQEVGGQSQQEVIHELGLPADFLWRSVLVAKAAS